MWCGGCGLHVGCMWAMWWPCGLHGLRDGCVVMSLMDEFYGCEGWKDEGGHAR